ncbi:MAG TPA: fibronectin type III domain-containing protein, partial [Acidimicrobiales bacterium]
GNIYIAHQGVGDRVTVLDPSLSQIAEIPITNPFTPVVNETTRRVYFAQTFGGGIEVVDATTNTRITTVPTSGTSTIAVDVDETRNLVYAVDRFNNTLSIMDGATNTIINTVATGQNPRDIAVDEALDKVYVTNTDSNSVYVYQGSTGTLLTGFSAPGATGVAINGQDHRAYVTKSDGTVSVVDTKYDDVVDVLSGGSPGQPWDVVTNAAAHRAYYTSLSQAVTVLDDPPAPASQIVGVPNSPVAESAFDAATAGQTVSTIDFDDGLVSDGQPVATAYSSRGVEFSGIVGRSTTSFTYSPPMGVWQANFGVGPPAQIVLNFTQPVASFGFYANDLEADARFRLVFTDGSEGAYGARPLGGGANASTFYGFTMATNSISQLRISTGDYFILDHLKLGRATPTFELSVTSAGSGAGSVASTPTGIDCGATCSAAFAEGTSVTLTAAANPGSLFSGWSGACSGVGPCAVTMTGQRSVTATFDPAPIGISGTVANSNGEPVGGIEVDALDSGFSFVAFAITDAAGRYSIVGLPPGSYRVQFSDVSATRLYSTQYYNEQSSPASANVVVLAPGAAVTGIDAVLVSTSISGTVTDAAAGVPLAGIEVDAFMDGSSVGYAFTDAAGHYTISGLSPGTFQLEFQDPRPVRVYSPQFYNGQASEGSATPVAVASGEHLTGYDAALVITSISGTLTNTNGDPVEGIQVDALDNGDSSVGFGVTDAAGHYTMSGLSPGSYRVLFTDTSQPARYSPQYYLGRATFASANLVTVASGQVVTGIDDVLSSVVVTGTVTDSNGVPLAGIDVSVQGSSGWAGGASTDSAGHYRIEGLPAGQFHVAFHDPSLEYTPDRASSPFTLTLGGAPKLVDMQFPAVNGPDGDGVPARTENGAPNNGDGNADGIADATQANVTSLPDAGNDAYVTIASPAGTALVQVDALPLSLPAPAGDFPVGLLAFRVDGVTPGASAAVQVFLPSGAAPNAFWKFQHGAYSQFPDAAVNGSVVTLSLQDGGPFDADGSANGSIVDPIALGTVTTVATTTSMSSTVNPSVAGDPVVLTATVTPASGATSPSGTVVFTIDGVDQSPAVGVVNGSASLPPITTLGVGNHTVTARYTPADGGFLASDSLAAPWIQSVVPGPLHHLVLAPASASVTAGVSQQYSAEGFDALGNDLGDRTAGTVFTIAPNGSCAANLCSATTTGSHTVTGTAGPATGTATLLVVAPTAPGAPTVTSVTPSLGQISVAFAPGSDGGSAITGYTAKCTSSNGGATRSVNGAGSPVVVTALTNTKTYTCTVTAKNAVGTGPASAPSAAVTLPVAPAAPTVTSVTPSLGRISVEFAAGLDGGAPITGFTATCVSSDGGVTKSTTGTGSPIAVAGLTNTKTYTCTVTAKNAVGTGPASAPSAAVTLPVAPAAPTVTSVIPSLGQIVLAFVAGSDGGAPITGFTATCVSGDGGVTKSATGTGSPIVVTGLTNTKTYTCTVTAKNAVGTGPASAPSAPVTLPVAPAAPIVTSVTPSLGQIVVAFVAGSDGGSAITGYTAKCTSSDGGTAKSVNGTASPIAITGLTNTKTYTCTVTAKNAVGTGPASAPSAPVTLPMAPAAPTVTSVTPGVGQIVVAFVAGSDGGAPITGYTAKCTSSNGGTAKSVNGTGSPIVVTGLTNTKTYTCTVTAKNAVGTGPASAPSASVVVPNA